MHGQLGVQEPFAGAGGDGSFVFFFRKCCSDSLSSIEQDVVIAVCRTYPMSVLGDRNQQVSVFWKYGMYLQMMQDDSDPILKLVRNMGNGTIGCCLF